MSARLGYWSAVTSIALGLLYVVALGAGVSRHGFHEPIRDPILAVMEVITLLSALPLVVVVAALHSRAERRDRRFSRVARVFVVLFAVTTISVHATELLRVERVGLIWPSTTYAIELVAWDVLLGGALVSVAWTLRGGLRWGLLFCGALCLSGIVGPIVDDMRLQRIGIVGYAIVLPLVLWRLARMLARERPAARLSGGERPSAES